MRTSSKQHASATLTSNAAEAVAFAERIIADAKSGAFRGLAVAYVCEQGPAIYVATRDLVRPLRPEYRISSRQRNLRSAGARLGQTAAPDAPLAASRVN